MEFNNRTVKIEILTESAPGDLTHSDIKLFFCLKGTTEIICGTEISLLVKEGIKPTEDAPEGQASAVEEAE